MMQTVFFTFKKEAAPLGNYYRESSKPTGEGSAEVFWKKGCVETAEL